MKLRTLLLSAVVGISFAGPQLARMQLPDVQVMPTGSGLQSTVRILHEWEQAEGDKLLRYSVPSLGTIVGPHIIVSHNHFEPRPGNLRQETLELTASDGAFRSVSMAQAAFQVTGAETTHFVLDVDLDLTQSYVTVADRAMNKALEVGDRLVLVYWNDQAERLAQLEFPVVATGPTSVTLADPNHLINGGDSGGGAYFQGRLIGNIWGYLTDQNGQPLGLVKVALNDEW